MATLSIMTMVFGRVLEEGILTDVELLAALEATGFDGVELTSGRLLAAPHLLDAYRAFLAGSRLAVPCVDVGCNLIGPDAVSRSEGVDALRRGIDAAAALGAPLVLAAGSRLSDNITPRDGRCMTAEGLEACVPQARAVGITLAIEDFGVAPTLQCRAADCQEVLDLAPDAAFVFDTGNFYFVGENPLDHVVLLSPKTRHVHLKDWAKSNTPQIADVSGTALGAGLIPNRELVRRLVAAGVASFSLEIEAPGDKLDAARQDLATARRWLADATRSAD